MACGIHGQYNVEADDTGWPRFYGDSKLREVITEQVRSILDECGPLDLSAIYDIGKHKYGWKLGATWDGIFAVLERAARSVANPVWKLKS